MTENIFTTLGLGAFSQLSIMAFLTLIVVQVLKQVVPKNFPTQLLTIIVALIIAIVIPLVAPAATISVVGIITSIFNGFIVAFISMNGYDSLKSIWQRVVKTDEEGEDE